MADDRITGYPCQCNVDTVTDVVSWPAGQWSYHVFYLLTTSHFVVNIDRSNDVQAILSVIGVRADGSFAVVVADASSWVDGDRCSPQRQATAYVYTTWADTIGAASEGDSAFVWYPSSDGENGPSYWFDYLAMGNTNPVINIRGMAGQRKIGIQAARAIQVSGTELALGTENIYIDNFRLIGQYNGIRINAQTGTYGRFIVDSCLSHCFYSNSQGIVGNSLAKITVQNCGFVSGGDGVNLSGEDVIVQHCTVIESWTSGYSMGNYAANYLTNCIGLKTKGVNMTGSANINKSHNMSMDASAIGTNPLASQSIADFSFYMDEGDAYLSDDRFRITADSAAFESGTPVGVLYDWDGNLRSTTTPSRGCHEGSLGVYYMPAITTSQTGTLDLPVTANVREGVGFDNGTKAGTLGVPLPAEVKEGVIYG